MNHQTYAQVIENTTINAMVKEGWKGIEFETKETYMKWLSESFIGRLKDYITMETFKEEMLKGGMGFLRIRSLGDNMVLTIGERAEEVGKIIVENRGWFEKLFESIVPCLKLIS